METDKIYKLATMFEKMAQEVSPVEAPKITGSGLGYLQDIVAPVIGYKSPNPQEREVEGKFIDEDKILNLVQAALGRVKKQIPPAVNLAIEFAPGPSAKFVSNVPEVAQEFNKAFQMLMINALKASGVVPEKCVWNFAPFELG